MDFHTILLLYGSIDFGRFFEEIKVNPKCANNAFFEFVCKFKHLIKCIAFLSLVVRLSCANDIGQTARWILHEIFTEYVYCVVHRGQEPYCFQTTKKTGFVEITFLFFYAITLRVTVLSETDMIESNPKRTLMSRYLKQFICGRLQFNFVVQCNNSQILNSKFLS